jgi:hypothetical protein
MPYDRLRLWQDFRHQISALPLEAAVKATEHMWSYAPYQKYYLTLDEVKNWPGPWELIFENYYCNLAIALGMLYTLYLSEHKPQVEIRVYIDPSSMAQYNLLFVEQGKYVLNMEHDAVLNKTQVSSSLKLKKTISVEDLGLELLQ